MQGPPKPAERLLSLFLSAEDRESVLGDLDEMFQEVIRRGGSPIAAGIWYWRQVFLSVFFFVLIRLRGTAMLRSCLESLRALGLGIIGYYAAVILYLAAIGLPDYLVALVRSRVQLMNFTYVELLEGIFLPFSGPFARRSYWIALIGPVIITIVSLVATRAIRSRLRFFAAWIVLYANYHLMAFVIMNVAIENWIRGGWPNTRAARISLSILLAGFAVIANYLAFRRLSRDAPRESGTRLLWFSLRFLLPAALVTLFMATNHFSSWIGWSLEGHAMILLPALLIALMTLLIPRRDGVVQAG